MNKHYGTKTIVLGGKKDVEQEYCGYAFRFHFLPLNSRLYTFVSVVGGQSTDFSTMDSEVKVCL